MLISSYMYKNSIFFVCKIFCILGRFYLCPKGVSFGLFPPFFAGTEAINHLFLETFLVILFFLLKFGNFPVSDGGSVSLNVLVSF